MHRPIGTDSATHNDGFVDLDELRSEALRYLTIVPAALAWGLNLIVPIMTSNPEATERFFLNSLALLAIAGGSAILLRHSVTLASTLVAGSATALIAIAAVVTLAFAVDFAVGRYQAYRLEQKRMADLRLQHAAFEGMYVEVVNVTYEPDDKSYRLTMRFTNDETGRPLYVMQSPVRVFEQVGLSWKEVPSRDSHGEAARVVKLADSFTAETIFEPNLKDWTELIPGYMHIRFQTESLISERSDPDDDIIERTDRYYVYLKPHDADDDAIRKQMKIRGDPPVYMPMPPH